jgi:hypothetical protein
MAVHAMSAGFMLRPFTVEVSGFGAFAYPAATRGRALADAWRDYRICSDTSFKDFLKIARARLSDRASRFGEPITVAGQPAFYVGERGQYVRFVRPGQTETFLSHPADVRPALAAGSRRAKTPKAVECEASQSGGDSRNAQGDIQ